MLVGAAIEKIVGNHELELSFHHVPLEFLAISASRNFHFGFLQKDKRWQIVHHYNL
jgi:hypothetical protein